MKLHIPDMSCGHCAGVITKALKALDPQAAIEFDMPARAAQVNTSQSAEAVLQALDAAGYPATAAQ